VIETPSDPRLVFDHTTCRCGGTGITTDATPLGGGLWLVTWTTEHRPGCPGLRCPERAYLVDGDALDAGDDTLPALPVRDGQQPRQRQPLPPDARRCQATVETTGQQCRNVASRDGDGLCDPHARQAARRRERATRGQP
jgi:hypothetical protein